MTLRHALLAALLIASVPAPAQGASKHAGPVPRHGGAVPTHANAARGVRPGAAPRTLDDIHIEGEIPVPQVLFITARDQRRFLEFQHRRYLRTSRKIGEDTVLPSWIVVTGTRPAEDRGSSR
jgi:hypothetical protein